MLKQQGKLEEAERIYLEVIENQTAALGASHTDTLSTKYNLGLLLDAGDRARARPLLEEAAADWAAALGEEHEDTQTARRQLARCNFEGNSASPWTRYTNGGRAFYVRREQYEQSLEKPEEGVQDERALPDEQFNSSPYAHLLKKKQMTEEGLLKPDSPWTRCTNGRGGLRGPAWVRARRVRGGGSGRGARAGRQHSASSQMTARASAPTSAACCSAA